MPPLWLFAAINITGTFIGSLSGVLSLNPGGKIRDEAGNRNCSQRALGYRLRDRSLGCVSQSGLRLGSIASVLMAQIDQEALVKAKSDSRKREVAFLSSGSFLLL